MGHYTPNVAKRLNEKPNGFVARASSIVIEFQLAVKNKGIFFCPAGGPGWPVSL
jgi:hypothetical protein